MNSRILPKSIEATYDVNVYDWGSLSNRWMTSQIVLHSTEANYDDKICYSETGANLTTSQILQDQTGAIYDVMIYDGATGK